MVVNDLASINIDTELLSSMPPSHGEHMGRISTLLVSVCVNDCNHACGASWAAFECLCLNLCAIKLA